MPIIRERRDKTLKVAPKTELVFPQDINRQRRLWFLRPTTLRIAAAGLPKMAVRRVKIMPVLVLKRSVILAVEVRCRVRLFLLIKVSSHSFIVATRRGDVSVFIPKQRLSDGLHNFLILPQVLAFNPKARSRVVGNPSSGCRRVLKTFAHVADPSLGVVGCDFSFRTVRDFDCLLAGLFSLAVYLSNRAVYQVLGLLRLSDIPDVLG